MSFPAKIVIATPFYPPQGGVLATYAQELERVFVARGSTVAMVSFQRFEHLPPGIRHLAYFYAVYSHAKGASFILALDTWSVGMPSVIAARTCGIPCVVRIGGDFLWESYVERTKEQILLSEFYEKSRALSLKERVIRAGTEWLLRQTIPLFTTQFQKDIWHRAYGVSNDAPIVENYFPPHSAEYTPPQGTVFVAAGRAIGLKNVRTLQSSIAKLHATHPELALDTELLPHKEHRARVSRAYAVAIPSFSEVCSNTAIDAVSLGKPFICPKDTGTSERLGACGIFVDTRSEAALTQAIALLLDPAVYARYSEAARLFSFSHSWEEIAEEVLKAVTPHLTKGTTEL